MVKTRSQVARRKQRKSHNSQNQTSCNFISNPKTVEVNTRNGNQKLKLSSIKKKSISIQIRISTRMTSSYPQTINQWMICEP